VPPIGQLTSHMDPREAFVGPSTQTKRKPTPRYHISSFSTQKCTANGSMIRHRHAVRTDTHSLAHSLNHSSTQPNTTYLPAKAPIYPPQPHCSHTDTTPLYALSSPANYSAQSILTCNTTYQKCTTPPPPRPGPQVHLSNSKF